MKYAGMIKNDISAAPGISLTFFTQGCPHRCKGCHNPETWDFEGGIEFTSDTMNEIIDSLKANDIQRNLCIMGGEPLCAENLFLTYLVIKTVLEALPKTKIYIWTGYVFEELRKTKDTRLKSILQLTDVLVDGPFIEEEKDITLKMRGSRNQKIIYLKDLTLEE